MKKTIKLISLLLALFMLLGVFSSCSENEGEDTETDADAVDTSEDTNSAIYASGLEIKDLGGREMNIWYSSVSSWSPYPLKVEAEEAVGKIVERAGYDRNEQMEKTLNIKLNYEISESDPNVSTDASDIAVLRRLVSSGDISKYDIVMTGARPAATLSLENFWSDLATMDDIHPDAYYYESQVNEQIRLKGHQFFASGYYSVMNTAAVDVTYVNPTIVAETAQIDLDTLYDLALNKQWTLEKLLEIGAAAATPADNVGDYAQDQYALILSYNYSRAIYYDLGGTVVEYDAANPDKPYPVTVNSSTNTDLLTYIQTNITNNKSVGMVKEDKHSDAFVSGAAPFMHATYLNVFKLSASDIEWSMLPTPLRNEGDEYRAYSDSYNLNLAGIPAAAPDKDTSAYLYEMFMAFSYDYVYPAYYEETFGTRYQPDTTTAEIFDILTHSRTVCMVNLYLPGTQSVDSIIRSGSTGVGSAVSQIATAVNTAMKRMLRNFDESMAES